MPEKKKFSAALLVLGVILACCAAAFAWFALSHATAIDESGGAVLKQYFHSGSGTKDDPYEITRPVHYYNLVMLYQANPQYGSGTFADSALYFRLGSKDLDNDGTEDQEDYRVFNYADDGTTDGGSSSTLNLAAYKDGLFPIGSADHPFQAEFDGSGLTLSNLKVTGSAQLNDKAYKTPDIGIFGYVSKSARIHDLYATDFSIDLTGVDASASYQTSATQETHRDHTGSAYAGYIAGHIVTGAQVTDVYVNNCTVTGGQGATTNFGFFGYVEDETGKPVPGLQEEIITYRIKGDKAGFGNTLDMMKIHKRLQDVWQNAAAPGKYASAETVVFDENTGSRTVSTAAEGSITLSDWLPKIGGVTTPYRYYTTDSAGRYYFIQDGSDVNLAQFMCLYGEDTLNPKTVTTYTISSDKLDAWQIASGGNWLAVNSTLSPYAETLQDNAGKWMQDEQGHLYTYVNYEPCYLNRSGAAGVTVSSGAETVWALDRTHNTLSTSDGDTTLYLEYSGGSWTLSSITEYSTISDGSGNYLTLKANMTGSVRISTDTSPTALARWQIKQAADGRFVFSMQVNGTTYYLALGGTGSSLTASTSESFWSKTEDGYFTQTANGSTYYFGTGSTGGFIVNTNPKRVSPLVISDPIPVSYELTLASVSQSRIDKSVAENVPGGYETYFPLRIVSATDEKEKDAYDEKDPYKASQYNTGYIVSGARLLSSSSTSEEQKAYGDIRISYYSVSNIEGSYSTSSNAFGNIYTVDDSGKHIKYDTSSVYQESSQQLLDILKGSSLVYGLHFMDAQISKDNLLTADQVTILNKTYQNYQMPLDSIDFQVIERGSINFFAGTYFPLNNAFFSLHQVFRDENQRITDIKEIAEVYQHTEKKGALPYIYRFTDGTYSDADSGYTGADSLPAGYESVFKTEWITNPGSLVDGTSTVNDKLYYFEIPCNKGEYCLGSVSGKTGAYLIYLDIASNGGDVATKIISTQGNLVNNTFRVDYRTAPDKLGEENHSVLLLGLTAPDGTDSSKFSVKVNFSLPPDSDPNHLDYAKGLYTIAVVNKSGEDLRLDVFLSDDDRNPDNDFLYAYQVVYTNGDRDEQTIPTSLNADCWQSMASFSIPASGAAREMEYTSAS